MAFSEAEIRQYIKALVEEYGELTVTDVDSILRQRLVLDTDDTKRLANRNDDAFSQKVRNVISHAGTDTIIDRYGFIIDKTQKPAVFRAKVAGQSITPTEARKRTERKRKYIARKVDFEKINRENSILGNAGELFVLEWERNRLAASGATFNLQEEVIHVSKQFGDGAGYDILSKEVDGSPLFIEVKTTTGGKNTSFFISENERAFLEEFREHARIYRVYNFDPDAKAGEIFILTQANLEASYSLVPVNYRVVNISP